MIVRVNKTKSKESSRVGSPNQARLSSATGHRLDDSTPPHLGLQAVRLRARRRVVAPARDEPVRAQAAPRVPRPRLRGLPRHLGVAAQVEI
jgi:hypothetical protein